MKVTRVYWKTLDAIKQRKSLIVSYGGSSSSKTVSIMQLLFTIAQTVPNQQIFMFAKTVPKLKTTLIEDFKRYVSGIQYFKKHYHNQEKFLLIPSTNSKIIFTSADEPDKFLGVRSDYLFFDEINTYRYGSAIFKNLFARCRKTTLVAFNPSNKFWLTDYMSEKYCSVTHSTYADNQFTPFQTIRNLFELGKKDENFRRVYINGDWGSLQGQIYKFKINWNYCESLPDNYDLRIFGLDFGFTKDPASLIELRIFDTAKEIYEKEHLYKTNMLNSEIAEYIKTIPGIDDCYIIADSAEPKSIAEIRKAEVNILGATKGADSIRFGIGKVKEYMTYIDSTSKNLLNEKMTYSYVLDKLTEKYTDVAEDKNNHLLDAERYGLTKFR